MSVVISKSIDITTIGSGGTFDLGWRGNGGVLFVNPTGFIVSLGLQSQSGPLAVLPGQMWKFPLTPQDASVVLNKTLFTSTALSTLLYWTVFNDPHDLDEIPQGQFSSYIANIIGGAGVTAQTLINDGNGAQNVIEMTLAGNVSGNSNVIIKNDGTLILFGQTKTGLQTLLEVAPGNPGVLALGLDNIVLDPVFGTTTITNTNTLVKIFQLLATGQIINPFPMQLLTGNQESGWCGCEGQATGAGVFVGSGVNFKTNMTNVPSSITLSGGSSNNANAPTTANISKLGFTVSVTAVAAGHFFIYRNYTTVGNCLLSFDDNSRTYEHHCDGCDRKDTYSYDTLLIDDTPHGLAIAHLCTCGMQECFTTTLTEADINTPLARLTQQFCASIQAERK